MNGQNPSTRAFSGDRSPARAAVDNLMRRALKISDPYDATEVAKGLLALYPDDAARIEREKLGLPFSMYRPLPVPAARPAGRPEAVAATDGLEAVLTQLTTSPDLADVAPEMRGWATTIRRAAVDGMASAAYAIDASERDRAFGGRRTLGDYGRLARYAAAVNSCATEIYCRLAQACDLIANLILVAIGDALADAGVTRSGAVIQVPTATLQARRDALIVALRNLLQLTPTDDQETWPRGTLAVQQIYDGLETAGAPDLRALLDEAYLSRLLDDLIDLATGTTPDGLRALGATAAVTVQRLHRFLILASHQVYPDSPPATTFFVELQLFIQSFAGGGAGYRLPYLSRSPLLVSGLLTTGTIDEPTSDLLALALQRTALADAIDCLCCTCDHEDTEDLVVAGKVLFEIDRAIDLYALGTDPDGEGDAEWSAAASGAVVRYAFEGVDVTVGTGTQKHRVHEPALWAFARIADTLEWPAIADTIENPPHTPAERNARSRQLAAVVNTMIEEEKRWADLVRAIAPSCRQNLLFKGVRAVTSPLPTTPPDITTLPGDPVGQLMQLTVIEMSRRIGAWGDFTVPRPIPKILLPHPVATSSNILAQKQQYA
jgi:hypothetical protein